MHHLDFVINPQLYVLNLQRTVSLIVNMREPPYSAFNASVSIFMGCFVLCTDFVNSLARMYFTGV